ncbi:MAG: hypothetical protein HY074_07420, partial [Deltaproteobacteria bacterium]|nr:hypothetical protein [Deltaproteobacteria bacterium]
VTYDPQRIQGRLREKMDHDLNEFVKTLVTVFGARPHWGKNRDWVLGEAVRAGNYGNQLQEFREVKWDLDPKDMFGNKLTRSLFAR